MTETEEIKTDKLFYSIGEVAELFKVNSSLIRFWEKEFDIIHPKKNKKGNRMFTPDDIKNFRIIYTLVKERGYTLQGAKEKLKSGIAETGKDTELADRLKNVRQFLVSLKDQL